MKIESHLKKLHATHDDMLQEVESIMKNHTWSTVGLASRKHPIITKWTFKKKPKLDGELNMFKAKLVVKGYEQKRRIDYNEAFVIMVKWDTI
jgi:hypothetical protein